MTEPGRLLRGSWLQQAAGRGSAWLSSQASISSHSSGRQSLTRSPSMSVRPAQPESTVSPTDRVQTEWAFGGSTTSFGRTCSAGAVKRGVQMEYKPGG